MKMVDVDPETRAKWNKLLNKQYYGITSNLTMVLSLLPVIYKLGSRRSASSRSKSIPVVRGRMDTMNASMAPSEEKF